MHRSVLHSLDRVQYAPAKPPSCDGSERRHLSTGRFVSDTSAIEIRVDAVLRVGFRERKPKPYQYAAGKYLPKKGSTAIEKWRDLLVLLASIKV